jgi:hypothetical protein
LPCTKRRAVGVLCALAALGLGSNASCPSDYLLFLVGSPLRFVPAIFSSSFLLIDPAMLRDAPFKEALLLLPRFAARAAPAAICCFLDFAGMAQQALFATPFQAGSFTRAATSTYKSQKNKQAHNARQ